MRKSIKKTISLLSIAPACSVALIPLASCSKSSLTEEHIISINDIHGAFAGYGETVVDVGKTNPGCLRLAREINKIKTQYPDTLLVSAGDENSGDAWSVCDHAGTAYPILSAMDFRYAAVGNHAFEWGLDDLSSGRYDRLGRTDKTEGNYFVCSNILGSNLYQNKTWCIDPNRQQDFITDFTIWYNQRVTWADPYKIVNFNNAKVCLIGLATVNTLIDGNKPITNLFSFIDYNAAVHYTKYLAKQQLGEAEFNKIDSFVLLTHCDSDYTDKVLTGEAPKLAAKIDTDIDAIISAHSHKVGCGKIWNNNLNKPISVGQAGTAGRYFLDTKLIVDKKAKPGSKVKEVSMEVKQVPIPETFEEAQKEWNELCITESDPYLKKVALTYEQQKTVVNEKVSSVLSEMNLDETKPNYTQKTLDGGQYAGYYNSVIHSGKKLGHEYYSSDAILDHFGGWASRAAILGYAIQNWQRIVDKETVIPSVAMFSQDSFPGDIKKGDIKLRDMFAIQPYDNYLHLSYLTVMQLASIINYALAGDPVVGKKHSAHGFDYGEKYQYTPDLHYYVISEAGQTDPVYYQTAFNINDDNDIPLINSGFLCGILNWYGVRVNLVQITEDEYNLTFVNPVTKAVSHIYDKSAKYRVKNKQVEITLKDQTKKTVWVPDIQVYNGLGDAEGVKWGNMKDIDEVTHWKDASYWYEHEHTEETGQELQLIPCVFNSFNYNGGNTQTKMFKEYEQYSILNYGFEFYGEDTPQTIRDFIITFCQNSYSDTLDWAQYVIPTNIIWEKIQKLVNFS